MINLHMKWIEYCDESINKLTDPSKRNVELITRLCQCYLSTPFEFPFDWHRAKKNCLLRLGPTTCVYFEFYSSMMMLSLFSHSHSYTIHTMRMHLLSIIVYYNDSIDWRARQVKLNTMRIEKSLQLDRRKPL